MASHLLHAAHGLEIDVVSFARSQRRVPKAFIGPVVPHGEGGRLRKVPRGEFCSKVIVCTPTQGVLVRDGYLVALHGPCFSLGPMRMQLLDDNLVSTLGEGKKCLRLENHQDIEIWGKEQGVQHGHAVSVYGTSMHPVCHKTASHGLRCPQCWAYHKVLITIKRFTFAGTKNEGPLMSTLALTIVMSYFSVEKLTFSWEMTSGKAQLQGPPECRPPGGTGAVGGSCHRLGDSKHWQASPPPDLASISTASQLCRSKVQVTCDKAGTDGQKSVPTTEIDCLLLLGLLIMKCYKLERQMACGLLKLQSEPQTLFFKHLRTFLQPLLF